ncbi:MAG: hypothetical protein JO112_15610, partial [Planctomycetes bacterium]|nr:hypothetical protein [Planctomycetota bacterium]
MRFWIREIAGWLLVALGLVVFYLCLGMLSARNAQGDPAPMILEVGPVVVIGVILFRGGIHLLKVAVAARICLEAQKRLGGTAVAAP